MKLPNKLCGPHKPFKTNQLTTRQALRNWGFTSRHTIHWGQASSSKQPECGRHGLSNILKLQATFLYSSYHQQAGKTKLFHMRAGDFTLGIRYVPLTNRPHSYILYKTPRIEMHLVYLGILMLLCSRCQF